MLKSPFVCSLNLRFLIVFSLLLGSFSSIACAQDDTPNDTKSSEDAFDEGGFDEGGFDEGGFDQLADIDLKPNQLPEPPSALRLDGFARSQWAAWSLRPVDEAWAKGRQNLDLSAKYKKKDWQLTLEGHLEYDLLYDVTEGPYDPVQEEEYRARYIPGIQSLSKRFSLGTASLTLSSGRQIVTWGESDGLSALDVINPQDQREPGVAEIDDIKLAVWLSRLQFSQRQHHIELIVRHEGHYGILVPPKADYSPFNAIMQSQMSTLPPALLEVINSKKFRFAHENEGFALQNQSYFGRYQYRGEGFDLGVYVASLLDLQGVIGKLDVNQFLDMSQNQVQIKYKHPRYTLTGVTLAYPMGAWLFKSEVVASIDKPVNVGSNQDLNSLEVERVHTLTTAFGLSYSGFADTNLSAEYQKGSLLSSAPEQSFFVPPNLDILALRVSRTFGRERFSAGAIVSMIVPQWSKPTQFHQPERGGLLRFDLSYRLLDQLKLGFGYIHYLTGEEFGPFYGLEEHDRVFAQLRWDFTLY